MNFSKYRRFLCVNRR